MPSRVGMKDRICKTILYYQVIGFGVLILFLWIDEILDIPHLVFRAEATPINWVESLFETLLVCVFGFFVIYMSWRFLKQIKYLEGFLPVCSFCKRIRVNDEWIPIEVYVTEHSNAVFSHGFCPECGERHYGELVNDGGLE